MSAESMQFDDAADSSEQDGQESRYLPGGRIEAEEIQATNVVSGTQHIAEQHIHLAGQKYVPPLQLPRRAEHFQDRMNERTWLLAHLQPGTFAPADALPEAFPHGIVFHTFYGRPETAVALEQLARTFGEDPLPTPAQAAQRALSGKHVLLVLDGAEEADNLEQVLAVCASCAVLVTSRRRSDAA